MPKVKNWDKEKDTTDLVIWRNTTVKNFTVEIVSFEHERMDDMDGWGYGYPAINSKGIPSSPEFFDTRDDAIKWAIEYMKENPY